MPVVVQEEGSGWCYLSQAMSHKLLAVVFWFILNAMVLSVIIADPSDLSNHLRDDSFVAPRIFLALVGLTGVLYLRAAFMDPGFLPNAKASQGDLKYSGSGRSDGTAGTKKKAEDTGKDMADELKYEHIVGNKRDQAMKAPLSKRAVQLCGVPLWSYHKYTYDPDESGVDKYYQPCHICEHGVALRAKHCSSCGKCVARYDHHCIWLGNCVGERNHGLFWWYLVCQTSVIIWGLYYLWSAIKWHGFSDEALGAIEGFVWANGLKILVFLFILLWSWLPLCLLGYHTYLLWTNQTTWEFNRKTRITYLRHLDTGSRPFDDGPFRNLRLICCTPKLLDWRFHTTMNLDPDDLDDLEK